MINFIMYCFLFLCSLNSVKINAHEDFTIDNSNLYLIEKAWSVNTGGPSCHAYYSIIINNRLFPGLRPWELRWNMIKDALDYAGKNVLELGCCMGLVTTCIKKYRGAHNVVGVDGPDAFLVQQGSPYRIAAAKWFAQAFEADVSFLQVDFNNERYEDKIGYDYDIVFCLSLLNWIHDKERFLRYLSCFNNIIFEGHDSLDIEVARFRRYGFNYRVLGRSDKGRMVIHFFK